MCLCFKAHFWLVILTQILHVLKRSNASVLHAKSRDCGSRRTSAAALRTAEYKSAIGQAHQGLNDICVEVIFERIRRQLSNDKI